MSEFKIWLQKQIIEAGGQRKFAYKTRVSPSTINNLLYSEQINPDGNTVIKLADATNTPLTELWSMIMGNKLEIKIHSHAVMTELENMCFKKIKQLTKEEQRETLNFIDYLLSKRKIDVG